VREGRVELKDLDPSLSLAVGAPMRTRALAILARIRVGGVGGFAEYRETRDVLADRDGTTHLSAYLKFGCVSVREAAAAAAAAASASGGHDELLRQFMWRAFYDQVAFHFPRVLRGQLPSAGPNSSLHPKFDLVPWATVPARLERWATGATGVPLVDAGMRELLTTGHMHNRARMVVASFLVHALHVDWRHGERHFARHLVDYHPTANSGGWQWASGGGADAQPYFRTLSPWRQAERHDPQCLYIMRHVPELAHLAARTVLRWHLPAERAAARLAAPGCSYPDPVVDHAAEVARSKTLFSKLSSELSLRER
jgi:deoxyribodipyrimidine photo-lyase